jgi:hypothetical protein
MTNVSPRRGKPGDIPGPPGIFPPEIRNVPLTPLSSDPSGISPAGGNIPSPIGNITGPSGISSAHRENHRPAGWGISPARSGASPAGGNIPGPIGNITGRPPLPLRPAENILMPKPPLGISPAGGNIPGPAHREFHRPAGIFPAHLEYPRPAGNIPVPLAEVSPGDIPVPFLFGGILRMTPYMDSEGPGPGRIAHMVYKRVAQVRYLAEHDTRSRTLSKR